MFINAVLRQTFTLAELLDAEAAYLSSGTYLTSNGIAALPGGYEIGFPQLQWAIDEIFAGIVDEAIITGTAAPVIPAAPLRALAASTHNETGPLSALPASVPHGAGQKIGVVAFSSFQLSDVADWLTLADFPATLLSQVSKVDVVPGGAPLQPGTPGESDVLLGVEAALVTAPGAQVIVYDAPSTGTGVGFEAIFNKMITDGVNVISNSFIYCEDQTTAADVQAVDQVLANAAVSGISAFSATGDYGSACSDGSPNTIAVPTDSPNITAVGASFLSFGPGVAYDGETWLDESGEIPPGSQSGFGTSSFFTLSAAGSNASISPPSAVTSEINGTAMFTVTDSTLEDVTLTAKTSDGLTLAQQPIIHFIAPPATSSLISEGPSSNVPADGSTAAIITITLTDALNRPTPGKAVNLTQGGGHSVITGPIPSVTDGNGKIVFFATDQDAETINYAGIDVSDGSQAVGNVAVTYTNASANGCPLNVLENAPGSHFTYTNYAWGFPVTSPNCLNPAGMAFDSSGNLYVSEYDGNASGLYKIPPGGGSASVRLNATAYPNLTNASGLAFSKNGTQLYMARQNPLGANGDFGDIVQVSTTDGSVIRTITTLNCATGLATDPISGDLFSDSPCGSPTAGPFIFRISSPESATPGAPTEYAPANGAQTLWFTPGGTLYTVVTNPSDGKRWIATFAGTNTASPGAVTYVAPAPGNFGAVPDASNQDSPSFIFTDETEGSAGGLDLGGYDAVDLTQTTPKAFNIVSNGSTNIYMIIGPDGCYYATQTDRIVRVAAADGSCNFTASNLLARVSLSPQSSTPTQGTSAVPSMSSFTLHHCVSDEG